MAAPPVPPSYHGHTGWPAHLQYDPSTDRFSDGYKPTKRDWDIAKSIDREFGKPEPKTMKDKKG